MRVRFQADANLNLVILLAVVRREPAIDFQTAVAANLAGLSDREVLAMAHRDGRVLVTHDQSTMPDHLAEFIAAQSSSGLLIVPQHLSVSVVVEDLLLIWAASEAEEWTDRACYLPL
jgi:hypothetical protein